MKKMLTLLFMGMLVTLSAQTEQGSWLIGGSTGIGFNHQKTTYKYDGVKVDGPKINSFSVNVAGEYFIMDNWALGADVGLATLSTKFEDEGKITVSSFTIMPTLAYYFDTSGGALPYLGAGVGFASNSEKFDGVKETHDGFAWKGKGGVLFSLFPSLYMDVGLSYGQSYSKVDSVKVNLSTLSANLGLVFSIKDGGSN